MTNSVDAEKQALIQPNEQFGDVTFIKYIDEPYFYKKDKDSESYDYGLFKCVCGRYEVSRVNRIIYSKKKYECIHSRKLDKNAMIYGDSINSWRLTYSSLVKKYGIDNVEWKKYVQFYEFIAPRWHDMNTVLATIGLKKRIRLVVDENATYVGKDTVTLSTEKRNAKAKTLIEPQVINGIEYNSLTEISKAYNIDLSTIYKRYMSGSKNNDLVK